MSKTPGKRLKPGWIVLLVFFGLADLAMLIAYLLHDKNVALLNPKGLIAQEQLRLLVLTVGVLLAVALPTLFVLYFTAWKYRESNTTAKHVPNAPASKSRNRSMWLIPIAVLFMLAPIMWSASHRLAPQKLITANRKPIKIQVIALRWKWLFIYPEQQIASVNFVQMPVNTPVEFDLTADETPMSSFWIPNLGGQLYSMTSHVNRLNLMADTAGDYPGSSAEINGAGFAGMRFMARASSATEFNQWVENVKQTSDTLDDTTYKTLVRPSENNPTALYATVDTSLYDKVLMKYAGSHEHIPETYEAPHE